MIFNYNSEEISTNLAGHSFEELQNGNWKLGLISDNVGLDNESSDFYKDHKCEMSDENRRVLKNKVTVKLIDNTIVTKHIIHWARSDNYFCITESNFWDRFTD